MTSQVFRKRLVRDVVTLPAANALDEDDRRNERALDALAHENCDQGCGVLATPR